LARYGIAPLAPEIETNHGDAPVIIISADL
jgi:hypothetical protein